MKTIFRSTIILAIVAAAAFACSEESDLAIKRVVAPVVMEKDNSGTEVTATFFELDKSGLMDHTVGIDSIPVPNLAIEVFAGGTSKGVFTTDADGSIVVAYTGAVPNEFAGTYKGIAFRFK